jgi:hypothetical protein
MLVSVEEVQASGGLHPHGELWVRVLSTQPMAPTNVLPALVAAQIDPEVLSNYRTVCQFETDLREDDDETIPEWPYEQWWALPRTRASE